MPIRITWLETGIRLGCTLVAAGGRASDSFVMNDLMRLPLGILSGMGLIGAGTIVRRHVVGLTMAPRCGS